MRLAPEGMEPIDGVIDYLTGAFLGVRTDDALYRFYGRDAWGWPVGIGHHHFSPGVDPVRAGEAWRVWLDAVTADTRSAA